jgi:hypothetical protein
LHIGIWVQEEVNVFTHETQDAFPEGMLMGDSELAKSTDKTNVFGGFNETGESQERIHQERVHLLLSQLQVEDDVEK